MHRIMSRARTFRPQEAGAVGRCRPDLSARFRACLLAPGERASRASDERARGKDGCFNDEDGASEDNGDVGGKYEGRGGEGGRRR